MDTICRYLLMIVIGCTLQSCRMSDEVNLSTMPTEASILFEYRLHLGLDCYMVADCGYKIVIDSSGTIAYWKDSGSMELISETPFSDADVEDLKRILQRGDFLNLAPEIPDPQSRRGMRTLKLSYASSGSGTTIVTAFLDETNYPFPEGFQVFENELREFLFAKCGIETGIRLDTTPRKF